MSLYGGIKKRFDFEANHPKLSPLEQTEIIHVKVERNIYFNLR